MRTVRAVFSFPLTDPANIRMLPELDGGALMDVGTYWVSGSRLLGREDAVAQARVLAALYSSADSGSPVAPG